MTRVIQTCLRSAHAGVQSARGKRSGNRDILGEVQTNKDSLGVVEYDSHRVGPTSQQLWCHDQGEIRARHLRSSQHTFIEEQLQEADDERHHVAGGWLSAAARRRHSIPLRHLRTRCSRCTSPKVGAGQPVHAVSV